MPRHGLPDIHHNLLDLCYAQIDLQYLHIIQYHHALLCFSINPILTTLCSCVDTIGSLSKADSSTEHHLAMESGWSLGFEVTGYDDKLRLDDHDLVLALSGEIFMEDVGISHRHPALGYHCIRCC